MWKKIIEELKKTENKDVIATFLYPFFPIKETREEIVVGYKSEEAFNFFSKNNFLSKIENIAKNLFDENTKVSFILEDAEEKYIQPQLPFEKNKNDILTQEKEENITEDEFKDYTFDNFVSGPSNQTVFLAANYIAKNPGADYNPLFIYGDSGVGKTHIVHAIGNYVKENKRKSVYYTTTNDLINQYVKSLSDHTTNEWRNEILKKDMLLIDDIQFMSKAEATQTEFFYIFNKFYENKKQIVITSDRYVSEIKDIHDRLKTRFTMGVSLDMKQPEYETRIAIVRKKAELYDMKNISDDAIEVIARNSKNNIRDIEGDLKTLKINSIILDENIDRKFVEKVLKNKIKKKESIDIDDIIKIVSVNTNCKHSDIVSDKRTKLISFSRKLAIFMSKKYTQKTCKEIGEKFGGRDHSTVISSINNIEKQISEDTNIKRLAEKIEKEIEELNSNN